MDPDEITRYIAETFADVDIVVGTEGFGAGDSFFFYDPNLSIDPAKRFPFATIVTKDYGEFDRASNLDRPGVFRLNIGVSTDAYRSLFSPQPRSPITGETADTGHDFTSLDQLLPHPVYAPQSWVCVLNPSEATFQSLHPLLAEAYDRAARRHPDERVTTEQ